eukprot:303362-Pelagomonas_calceolata.AAC.2
MSVQSQELGHHHTSPHQHTKKLHCQHKEKSAPISRVLFSMLLIYGHHYATEWPSFAAWAVKQTGRYSAITQDALRKQA